MAASDRRTALRWMALAATLPAFLSAAQASAAQGRVAFPDGRFRLRRELERGLAGGASLTVVRDWGFHFEEIAGGSRADGSQVDCQVTAPAVLAPLAEIEQARVAPGPFPALLDAQGRIRESAHDTGTGKVEAVRIALALLEEAGTEPSRLSEARAYLGALAQAAGAVISATPPDLFFPTPGEATESREIALSDGQNGSLTVELKASARGDGLLDRLERRITATIADDTRVSRETWAIQPA